MYLEIIEFINIQQHQANFFMDYNCLYSQLALTARCMFWALKITTASVHIPANPAYVCWKTCYYCLPVLLMFGSK
jgi:hypothetical protein